MEHLKQLRISRKLSQQDVADYLGITRQAYCNYENGNRRPDNETLLKLGEFFDVSVDYLLRGPTETGALGAAIDDTALKFALFGDTTEITDADLDDVKRYAAFVRERRRDINKDGAP